MAQGGPSLGDSNERLATNSQHPVVFWDGLSYPGIQLHYWLLRRCSANCNPLPSRCLVVHSQGCQMNKKHLGQVLEEARLWTNAEYEAKGGNPETDKYHIQKQLARLTLLQHIADTYLQEQRENGQL